MKQSHSRYRWVILLLAFIPPTLLTLCQYQSTAYAPELMRQFSLTDQQYTTVATAPMLLGVFISFLAGTAADRFGVKKTVTAAVIVSALCALARSFVTGYLGLLAVTVLMGCVGVVINANNAKIMTGWFPPAQLGLAIGLVASTGNSGTIIAMALGKSLSASVSKAFLYSGIAFAVAAVLWILFFRDRPRTENAAGGSPVRGPKPRLGSVLKNRTVWTAALAAAFFMCVNISVSALVSPGLMKRGVADTSANLTIVIFSVTALAASVLFPGLIARTKNTKITCAVLSVAAGLSLYFGWLTDSAVLRNVLIPLCGLCLGGLLPTLLSIPAVLPEIGPDTIGAAGGLITTVMMAGAFLLPSYVVTPIAGGINDTAFLILLIVAVILGGVFLLLPNVSIRAKDP